MGSMQLLLQTKADTVDQHLAAVAEALLVPLYTAIDRAVLLRRAAQEFCAYDFDADAAFQSGLQMVTARSREVDTQKAQLFYFNKSDYYSADAFAFKKELISSSRNFFVVPYDLSWFPRYVRLDQPPTLGCNDLEAWQAAREGQEVHIHDVLSLTSPASSQLSLAEVMEYVRQGKPVPGLLAVDFRVRKIREKRLALLEHGWGLKVHRRCHRLTYLSLLCLIKGHALWKLLLQRKR